MAFLQGAKDFLGMGESSSDFAFPTSAAPASQNRAPRVTSLSARRSNNSAMTEISTFEPTSYHEAKDIAVAFREGLPVIVNLGQVSEVDARHYLDFLLGLQWGLDGHLKRVTPKVFLLTPNHVAITNEEEGGNEFSDELLTRP
jgi:cell division inhibitor SepF